MTDLFQIGLSGLLAFQRAIGNTGHNIANVNTEGYSRQRTDFSARLPQQVGAGIFFGTGTQIESVRRIYDSFVGEQVQIASSGFGRLDAFNTLANRVDNLLADPNVGITPSLQSFFDTLQQVADDPSNLSIRQLMLSEAGGLESRFQDLERRFQDLNDDVNSRIRESVAEINGLATTIADLNDAIVRLSAGGVRQAPGDLLDQRDLAIRKLAAQLNVETVAQNDGSVNVFVGSGQSLVLGRDTFTLTPVNNRFDASRLDIEYSGGAVAIDMTRNLTGGELGGILDFRREMLDTSRNALGQIAVGLVQSFNEQHRDGMTLAGQLGGDFFSIGTPRVYPADDNTGAGTVSVSYGAAADLTTADYFMSFDGAAWQLTRSDTLAVVPMTGTGTAADPFVAEGLSIVVGGAPAAGDEFMVQPTRQISASIDTLVDDPAAIAAAAPIRAQADLGNLGDATVTLGEVLDVTDPGLLNTATIVFTDPNTYTINGGPPQAYAPGGNIDFNGWRVQIEGSPQAGDTFTVESNSGGIGDNRNALLMGDLQSAGVLDGGTSSYSDSFGKLVAQVGVLTQQSSVNLNAQTVLKDQAEADLAALSGVNLDEEAANLLRYQQAYDAVAQSVSVADELFQTLLRATGR